MNTMDEEKNDIIDIRKFVINSYSEMFKIDNLGKGIVSKILFVGLFLIRFSLFLLPESYSDFSQFVFYMEDLRELMLNDPQAFNNLLYTQLDIPITGENLIYIFLVLVVNFICIIGVVFYCGLYIRQRRIDINSFIDNVATLKNEGKLSENSKISQKIPGNNQKSVGSMVLRKMKVIDIPNYILRLIIVSLFIAVIYIPSIILLLYLSILFIIIFPCFIVFFACYLSGDYDFFESFRQMVIKTKGFYMRNANHLSTLVLIYFIASSIIGVIATKNLAITYVLDPFITVFLCLAAGRYIGIVYCQMNEKPTHRRPIVRPENDMNPRT